MGRTGSYRLSGRRWVVLESPGSHLIGVNQSPQTEPEGVPFNCRSPSPELVGEHHDDIAQTDGVHATLGRVDRECNRPVGQPLGGKQLSRCQVANLYEVGSRTGRVARVAIPQVVNDIEHKLLVPVYDDPGKASIRVDVP